MFMFEFEIPFSFILFPNESDRNFSTFPLVTPTTTSSTTSFEVLLVETEVERGREVKENVY